MVMRRWTLAVCILILDMISSQTALLAQEGDAAALLAPEGLASVVTLAEKGRKLSAHEAQRLEKELAENPDDLASRTQLLGYYWSQYYTLSGDRKVGRRHVLWIIEHRPDAVIAGLPYMWRDPHIDKDGYSAAKAAWVQQIDKHGNDAQVLGNAAAFFQIHDSKLSESCLKKAQSIEPGNPAWAEKLGELYVLEASRQGAANKQRFAEKALEQFERALKATQREGKKPPQQNSWVNSGSGRAPRL